MNSPVLSTPEGIEAASAPVSRWWVLQTLPRCEKKLDAWLALRNFGHYLPTRPKKRSYPGKTVTFEHPLFAGYTFGRFSLFERNAVYGSGHAAAALEVVDQKGLLRELEQIRLTLQSGSDLKECAFLTVGRRARITSGNLKGLEGVVIRGHHKTRLILSVEILQRSVAVEIDPEWLESLG